jgi:hypothetical protein
MLGEPAAQLGAPRLEHGAEGGQVGERRLGVGSGLDGAVERLRREDAGERGVEVRARGGVLEGERALVDERLEGGEGAGRSGLGGDRSRPR